MKIQKTIFFTIASALCLSLSSCGDDEPEGNNNNGGGNGNDDDQPSVVVPADKMNTPDELLGKWEFSFPDEEGESESMVFTFKPNGIATMDQGDGYDAIGYCYAAGNNLAIDFGAMKASGKYSVKGNQFQFSSRWSFLDDYDDEYTLKSNVSTLNMTLYKLSDNYGFVPTKVANPIVGTWERRVEGQEVHVFTFYKNGLFRYYQSESDDLDLIVAYSFYKVDGNKLTLLDSNGNPSYLLFYGQEADFSIDNDILSITFEGETIYFNSTK